MSNFERPLSFTELQANITTGVWDRVRLAAKFITSHVAGTTRELAIDLPKAVYRADDPITYLTEKTKRSVERLQEVGAWAVEQEMVPADAKAPLPTYQRLV